MMKATYVRSAAVNILAIFSLSFGFAVFVTLTNYDTIDPVLFWAGFTLVISLASIAAQDLLATKGFNSLHNSNPSTTALLASTRHKLERSIATLEQFDNQMLQTATAIVDWLEPARKLAAEIISDEIAKDVMSRRPDTYDWMARQAQLSEYIHHCSDLLTELNRSRDFTFQILLALHSPLQASSALRSRILTTLQRTSREDFERLMTSQHSGRPYRSANTPILPKVIQSLKHSRDVFEASGAQDIGEACMKYEQWLSELVIQNRDLPFDDDSLVSRPHDYPSSRLPQLHALNYLIDVAERMSKTEASPKVLDSILLIDVIELNLLRLKRVYTNPFMENLSQNPFQQLLTDEQLYGPHASIAAQIESAMTSLESLRVEAIKVVSTAETELAPISGQPSAYEELAAVA